MKKVDEPPIRIENVHKVAIAAYSDKNFQTRIGQFYLPINPESYSESRKVNYDTKQGAGDQGTDARYKSTAPEELKLDFTLDGTDTVEGYAHLGVSVEEQISDLLKIVYDMDGDIHKPRFLIIFWGALQFPCVLSSIDIKYTLLDSDGKILRAKVTTSFFHYLAPKIRTKKEGKKSPDLTHVRTFTASDRMDLLAFEFYKDPQFVLQISKANKLTSFRKVTTGQELFFPPLDKTEE